MTAERWGRIEDLYHAALEREPEARKVFLEEACAGDEDLRREVESLLAQDGPGRILNRSLRSVAADVLTPVERCSPGAMIGPYRIVEPLGRGGMGEVYRATDTRLGRDVALKFLPADQLADPERRRRFLNEARSASALNHPHIVTFYDLLSDGSEHILVLECVMGRTLDRLIGKDGLRLRDALAYAVQIADALAAAHQAGIVHRDLKPRNVIVTESGTVKLLDFGLAKFAGAAAGSDSTSTLNTAEGRVVGTVAYMSPEQAEGLKVDARSDIFSFGVVLYEMLTGRKAFLRDTTTSTLAAILRDDFAPVEGIPESVRSLLSRCLRKDAAKRAQSMADIKIALEEIFKEATESGASVIPAAPAGKSAGRWRWMAVAGATLALGATLWILPPHWRETRPPLKEAPLTSFLGYQGDPTLSPDGSQFAFVWDGGQANAPPQLYVSLIGQGTPLRLTNTPMAGAGCPAWSPDGQTIAFVRYPAGRSGGGLIPTGTNAGGDMTGDLILIPALGGPERRIDEVWSRPAWSPDGKRLYFSAYVTPKTRALFVEAAGGGAKRQLTSPPGDIYGDGHPSVSPDGRRLVFVRSFTPWNQELFVADLVNGDIAGALRQLTSDHHNKSWPLWTTDGEDVIYIEGSYADLRSVYRVRASGGAPVRVEGIGDYADVLAMAPKGHRLAYSRSFRDLNIWRRPLPARGASAGIAGKFLSSTRLDNTPEYSSDGTRVAFSSNRGGVSQIWVGNADGSNPVALTNFSQGRAGVPKWSPDSRTIVFDARPDGGFADVYMIQAEGGPPRRMTDHPADDVGPCYSTDGHWIYFASGRSGQPQIYRMPASGGEAAQITREGGFVPVASPDGKWIYYHKWEGGIWKVPVDGGKELPVLDTQTVSANPFTFDVTATGIYFAGALDPASRTEPLKLFRFSDGKTVELGRFDKPLNLGFSVSPDEKWLLYSQLDSSVDDLMLVDNFR